MDQSWFSHSAYLNGIHYVQVRHLEYSTLHLKESQGRLFKTLESPHIQIKKVSKVATVLDYSALHLKGGRSIWTPQIFI